jgi:hypothetical protein
VSAQARSGACTGRLLWSLPAAASSEHMSATCARQAL